MFKTARLDFQTTILAAVVITLYWLLPLSDPDYFWHIKTGEFIYNARSILGSDPFSFTMQGENWVLHEWLFQLVLYLINSALGENGIRILVISALAVTLHFSRLTTIITEQHKVASVVLILWMLLILVPFISPRPQVFSYLLFAYYLYATIHAIKTNQAKHLIPLPFLMIFWVNLHGGYLIGVILLLLTTISLWLGKKELNAPSITANLTKHFALATLVTFLASAINPDFIDHWKYPFYVLSLDATPQISEWRSPNFKLPYARLFLLFVVLFVLSLIYAIKRPSIERIVIPFFFIATAFDSTRNIPFAAISIMAFFPKVTEINLSKIQFITRTTKTIREKHSAVTSKGNNIGNLEYVMNGALLIFLAIMIPLSKIETNSPDDTYPHKAIDYYVEQELHGNILSEYKNGGYLIYRLYPSSLVFIDGRADMYGDKIFSDHSRIMRGFSDWKLLFNSYDINYVICNNDAPIRQLLLQQSDFNLLYDDKQYSIIENVQHMNPLSK